MLSAIVPIKPLRHAKGRLSTILTPSERRSLALAMFHDVLTALCATPTIDQVVVVTRDAEAWELAQQFGVYTLHDQAESLNGALEQAAQYVSNQGSDLLLALPADLPLITPAELAELIYTAQNGSHVVLAPSRDGGTNSLLRPTSLPMPFLFGIESLEQHRQAAHALGASTQLFRSAGLELDIDQPSDLELLAQIPGNTAAQRLARSYCVYAQMVCL